LRATAVIAAAGSGQRLGAGGPKALIRLRGRPMIEWSLIALAEAESIGAIVIAAPPGAEAEIERLAGGRATVITGGATRAESVRLALEAGEGDVVAIHDAARPLVTPELVDRLVARLADSDADGVIAASPIADTMKRAGAEGAIAETVDRSGLWAAQTPQAFRTEALRSAQTTARDAGELEAATDEAWLIERAGGVVLVEPTGSPNLKVTDPSDLAVAEALLASLHLG
jgi:2-C-methyl-D-erythritol 4-phosphate cytidylyltransferase